LAEYKDNPSFISTVLSHLQDHNPTLAEELAQLLQIQKTAEQVVEERVEERDASEQVDEEKVSLKERADQVIQSVGEFFTVTIPLFVTIQYMIWAVLGFIFAFNACLKL